MGPEYEAPALTTVSFGSEQGFALSEKSLGFTPNEGDQSNDSREWASSTWGNSKEWF